MQDHLLINYDSVYEGLEEGKIAGRIVLQVAKE